VRYKINWECVWSKGFDVLAEGLDELVQRVAFSGDRVLISSGQSFEKENL
jgi:hypothetical protein